jgi:hypothetical protein
MTRELARIKTIQKFTNLLDGTLLPGYSVAQVISYYESQLLGVPTDNISRIDGITANFMEDYINNLDDGDQIL